MNIINLLKKLEDDLVLDHFTGNHNSNKLKISEGVVTLDGQELLINLVFTEGNNGGGEHTIVASRNLFDAHECEIKVDGNEWENPRIKFKFHQQGLHQRIEFDFLSDNDKYRIDGTIEGV